MQSDDDDASKQAQAPPTHPKSLSLSLSLIRWGPSGASFRHLFRHPTGGAPAAFQPRGLRGKRFDKSSRRCASLVALSSAHPFKALFEEKKHHHQPTTPLTAGNSSQGSWGIRFNGLLYIYIFIYIRLVLFFDSIKYS